LEGGFLEEGTVGRRILGRRILLEGGQKPTYIYGAH